LQLAGKISLSLDFNSSLLWANDIFLLFEKKIEVKTLSSSILQNFVSLSKLQLYVSYFPALFPNFVMRQKAMKDSINLIAILFLVII